MLIKEWLIHVKSDSFTERGLFELILKEKEFSQILGASKFSGKCIFANLENSTWPGVYECISNSHSWSQCFNHTKLKSVYFHQLTTWKCSAYHFDIWIPFFCLFPPECFHGTALMESLPWQKGGKFLEHLHGKNWRHGVPQTSKWGARSPQLVL